MNLATDEFNGDGFAVVLDALSAQLWPRAPLAEQIAASIVESRIARE